MGFRFRKSFGKGPLRVTVSKSGIGYSAGVKGFRVAKKANGGTRTTASIPGTGFSYVKDTGSGGKRSRPASHAASAATSAAPVNKDMVGYCAYCYRKIGSADVCPICGRSQTKGVAKTPNDKKATWGGICLIAGLILLFFNWLPAFILLGISIYLGASLEKDKKAKANRAAPADSPAPVASSESGEPLA